MLRKRSVRDIELAHQRVLIRSDFDVPLDEHQQLHHDYRIRAALPTIRYCLEQDSRVVLISHLGEPDGTREPGLSLKPIAERLQELLERRVTLIEDPLVWSPQDQGPDEIVLLENLRFHPGEQSGDASFAQRLAALGNVYVNDAFALCHRQDASVGAVPQCFSEAQRVIGLSVERELQTLGELLETPDQPLVVVLGGGSEKIANKMQAIEVLLEHAESILIGGALAYTFLQAGGHHIGASYADAEQLATARRLIARAEDRLILPEDYVIADHPDASGRMGLADGGIPPNWHGLDIGPKTIERYREAMHGAATIVWNGPLGKFEDEPFRNSTIAIVQALLNSEGKTIVAGGHSTEALEQFGRPEGIDHVCTGSGAFLEYLQGRPLAALAFIDFQSESSSASSPTYARSCAAVPDRFCVPSTAVSIR